VPCLLQTVLFYVFGIFFFIISETFFLRNTFSEVTFYLERKDFFEPDFCVFFSEVMFIFVKMYVTCFMRVFV
jgi:hypothetical protein